MLGFDGCFALSCYWVLCFRFALFKKMELILRGTFELFVLFA
uniref:Uncharacterized protein n=1 Tax=Rhizophora mucronata TaxID=61149 RepID=A0A2P2Q3X9_RHIMU